MNARHPTDPRALPRPVANTVATTTQRPQRRWLRDTREYPRGPAALHGAPSGCAGALRPSKGQAGADSATGRLTYADLRITKRTSPRRSPGQCWPSDGPSGPGYPVATNGRLLMVRGRLVSSKLADSARCTDVQGEEQQRLGEPRSIPCYRCFAASAENSFHSKSHTRRTDRRLGNTILQQWKEISEIRATALLQSSVMPLIVRALDL
jgi:hypothetical protein